MFFGLKCTTNRFGGWAPSSRMGEKGNAMGEEKEEIRRKRERAP